MNERIVHVKREPYDVYIGRPSKWGNPFPIGKKYGDRDNVIRLYCEFIMNNPVLLSQIFELHGKTLGCYCAPKACHGDVLLEILHEQENAILNQIFDHG